MRIVTCNKIVTLLRSNFLDFATVKARFERFRVNSQFLWANLTPNLSPFPLRDKWWLI
jgi:hypothetical protein